MYLNINYYKLSFLIYHHSGKVYIFNKHNFCKINMDGGEKMVEQQQASGGSLVGVAIIILILFLLFPAFTAWLIWILIIWMLIIGIIGLLAGRD